MSDRDAQRARDLRHARHPRVGDYWFEMMSPMARVLMVDSHRVLVQKLAGYGGREIKATDPKPVVMSRRAFQKWLSYESIPGTWAHVVPEKFKDMP